MNILETGKKQDYSNLNLAKQEGNMYRTMIGVGGSFGAAQTPQFNPIGLHMMAGTQSLNLPAFEEKTSVESVELPARLVNNNKIPRSK